MRLGTDDWRPGTPRRAQIALLAGFGGLLVLVALSGIDIIRTLDAIRTRNAQIRTDFLVRNDALDHLRASLYLSGTFVRDYLLDRDPERIKAHRAVLEQARREAGDAVRAYRTSLHGAESPDFERLVDEVNAYWKLLDPVFHWSLAERREHAESLWNDLLPRRSLTLAIADGIVQLNERELGINNEQLDALFARFRQRHFWILVVMIALGAALAGTSLRHILRLYAETLRARAELQELSARLVEAQEQERRAISRELHDEVGQSLTALLMELGNLGASAGADGDFRNHLHSIRALAESCVRDVRNMALLLRPSMLDDLGLVAALQWHARELSNRTGIDVEVEACDVADDLPEDVKTCVYRVVQEALNNAARHSGGRSVRVRVEQHSSGIRLSVKDDGRGFDTRTVRGLGLLGMEERVTHLRGTFRVHSEPGRGTLIDIGLPIHRQAARTHT